MNIEMLIKVRDAIASKPPENFAMANWVSPIDGEVMLEENGDLAACGTSMCIAGWAMFLDGRQDKLKFLLSFEHSFPGAVEAYDAGIGYGPTGNARTTGAEILGLNFDESYSLFYKDRWPPEYALMGEREGALAILDYMIEHGEMPFEGWWN